MKLEKKKSLIDMTWIKIGDSHFTTVDINKFFGMGNLKIKL